MKKFQLDIITPTNISSYENVSYLRIPSLDGLTGIQARHTAAIIGLDIGEIKVNQDNKEMFFSTSGGFADIKPELFMKAVGGIFHGIVFMGEQKKLEEKDIESLISNFIYPS